MWKVSPVLPTTVRPNWIRFLQRLRRTENVLLSSGRVSVVTRDNILLVRVSDTSLSAQAIQLQIQRAMTGEQRLLMAFEMSMFARELAKAGIRGEHPEWPEHSVSRELLRLAFLPAPLPARLQ